MLAQAAFAGVLVALTAFFAVRLARRRPGARPGLRPPVELVWVPFALLHGLAGAALLAGGQAGRLPPVPLHAGRAMLQEGPDRYFELLGAAAALWLAAAAVWLVHVAPRLLRTIPASGLERLHEESKLRAAGAREGSSGG